MNDDTIDSIIYTTTGISSTAIGGTLTIDTSNSTWNSTSISSSYTGALHSRGDMIVDGDLKIQGESIKELLEEIKDKLAIFKPNTELEEKWEKLRELRRQYLELEKDILEKEEIIRILKR